MAKEQWHNWGQTAVILAGILFAGGGYAMKIIGNTTAIAEIRTEVEEAEDDIVDLKLQYKDIEGLTSSTLETLKGIQRNVAAMNAAQQKLVTDVAVISEKVNTLTRD